MNRFIFCLLILVLLRAPHALAQCATNWTLSGSDVYYTAGNVGIGTATPVNNLHVLGSVPNSSVWPNLGAITLTGEGDGTYRQPMIAMRSAGTAGYTALVSLRSRGTLAAPTPIQTGDLMSIWATKGYDGANWADGVNYVTFASENWTTTAHGSHIAFRTIPNGQTAMLESLFLHNSGNVGLQTATPAKRLTVEVPHANNVDEGLLLSRGNGASTFGFKLKSEGTGQYWGAITGKGNGLIEKELMSFVIDNTNFLTVGIGVAGAMPATLYDTYALWVGGDINSSTLLRVANTSVCTSAGCIASSDARLKKNIRPLDDALENVLKLEGVSYRWKDPEKFRTGNQVGLIAQEVEKVYPEVVITDTRTGMKSIAYDALVAPVIESIKTLHGRLSALETQVAGLLASWQKERHHAINALEAQADGLERDNAELKTQADQIDVALNGFRNRLDSLDAAAKKH